MFGPISEGMRLFRSGASVAVVGYSEKPHRVSHKVTSYLLGEGNKLTGINPNLGGSETKIPVVKQLADLKVAVDIIQVFRNSIYLSELAGEILDLPWKPQLIWCQQGVVDLIFQQRLERAGIPVVMDACPYALRSYL